MKKEIKGVCFIFSETGTEGSWWAVQEDGFVSDDGDWKYEGVRYLEEGTTSPSTPATVAYGSTA